MGVRNATVSTQSAITNNIPNATTTIVASVGPLGLVQDNAQVLIYWYFQFLTGVGAATLTANLRRGSTITSTVINRVITLPVTASAIGFYSGSYTDLPGLATGLFYSIDFNLAGGAAVLSVQDTSMFAMVL